ncbi:MAG: hypothetical protein ACLFTY_02730 [Candidatus Aenigmatarchaeota archaeon]
MPIKAVVVLTLAIIVLLAIVALFTSAWKEEAVNETASDAEDLLPELSISPTHYDIHQITPHGKLIRRQEIQTDRHNDLFK